jgi:hypothetical protein
MTLDDVRQYLESNRDAVVRRAADLKDSQMVLEVLRDLFLQISPADRRAADEVIAEWAISKDEAKRFDALALIDEMGILLARPALEQLARRLDTDSSPGARYEQRKVVRILNDLRATGS